MKSLSTVGIVLVILSALLFYLTTGFDMEQLNLSHLMGITGGIGLGLIIGGIIGYLSKGSAVKAERKRKEYLQLQKEKLDKEKQVAEIARQQSNENNTTTTNNSF